MPVKQANSPSEKTWSASCSTLASHEKSCQCKRRWLLKIDLDSDAVFNNCGMTMVKLCW